jgi:hypothetical protein
MMSSTNPARFTTHGALCLNAAMGFREPAYAVLSAVLGMVTLILGMLAVFFVFAGIRGTLNQAVPHDAAWFGAILICFVVAIACGLVAAVCASHIQVYDSSESKIVVGQMVSIVDKFSKMLGVSPSPSPWANNPR